MRKKLSTILKFSIAILSFVAVTMAMIFAEKNGYSHWYKRLYYFTQQSNIWIGVTCLIVAILVVVGDKKQKLLVKNHWYILKYIFTVSITITGIIFCSVLAPFADFDIWTFSSVLTHVVVPLLSIVDFFLDDYKIELHKKHIFLNLVPPFVYFILASILCLCRVDFGLGDPYPYFFMDYYSEVGLFGYISGDVPQIGSFYWILIIAGLVLGLGYLYYRLHHSTRKRIADFKNQNK